MGQWMIIRADRWLGEARFVCELGKHGCQQNSDTATRTVEHPVILCKFFVGTAQHPLEDCLAFCNCPANALFLLALTLAAQLRQDVFEGTSVCLCGPPGASTRHQDWGHRQRCVYTHIASCASSASFSEGLNRASASFRPASRATGDTQDTIIDREVRIAWFIRATRTSAAAALTSLN